MLSELLGLRAGILEDLHADHEEVAQLMEEILGTRRKAERSRLFRDMKSKLLAHAEAEAKVLYRRLEKSKDLETRSFGFEGEVEHQLVAEQLEQLARGRNKENEQWTARFQVLKELVEHHVREEERDGFARARKELDGDALERLGEQFRKEKGKLLADAA
jgi:hemerythrin superfamily protein